MCSVRFSIDTGENCIPNEELHDCCSVESIIGVITMWSVRWLGHVAHKGVRRDAYRVLLEKPYEKRPFGISSNRMEDNIKVTLK